MKKLILGVTLIILTGFWLSVGTAEAATRVSGYYKPSSGTYVMPSFRSSPNSTRWDNYSTQGNSNPFTGKRGYASPYKPYRW